MGDRYLLQVKSFESHLNSLRTRGFLRPYKPYTPPADLDQRFGKVCGEVLGEEALKGSSDLSQVKLDTETRARLLPALEKAIDGHRVPNSLLHTLSTLQEVLLFYSTPVETSTPYDLLADAAERSELPPNLQVQRDAHRFSLDEGAEPGSLGVDAYPRVNSVMVSPEARKKYSDVIKNKSPWRNAYSDTE